MASIQITKFRVELLLLLKLFVSASITTLVLLWSFGTFKIPLPKPVVSVQKVVETEKYDQPTFYDDPNLSYLIERPVEGWDTNRAEWLRHHNSFKVDRGDRILVITGTQPGKCEHALGDYLQLKMFKNKVDYCRIHGYEIYYNNLFLHPQMKGSWAKLPIIRAAMIAHPEAEWIWWVDADAVFTDMDFTIPIERYKNHNLVINGWADMIYKYQSWIGLNTGVFLIRNCQWSMDLLDVWAGMGPQTPNYRNWGRIQKSALKDKVSAESGDQSSLTYLMLKENKKWGNKIYLETEYALHGYWLYFVDSYVNISKAYTEMEKEEPKLRKRCAEKQSESYGEMMELYIKEKVGFKRRPFTTHFTGCSPCTGRPDPIYTWEQCFKGMENALNFADNQVLRYYGFVHQNLSDSSLSMRMEVKETIRK